MICFRGLTHHDISFSRTAAGGYLLLEKILNKIRLSAMTNGENKGSSREVKVLTNMSIRVVKKNEFWKSMRANSSCGAKFFSEFNDVFCCEKY